MANIDELDTKPGTGVLMPIMQYRWRFILRTKSDHDRNVLTLSIVRVCVDYKSNMLTFEFEDNVTGEVTDALYALSKLSTFTCEIQCLGGDNGIYFSNQYTGTTIQTHTVVYDYALSGVLTHKMTAKFDFLRILEPAP